MKWKPRGRWTRWRRSSSPSPWLPRGWPRPSVRVAVPEAGIHLKSDSSTWITTGFPYPAPEVCVRGEPTEEMTDGGGDVKAFGRQCLPGRSRHRSSGIESNGLPPVVRFGEGLVEEGGSVG